MIEFGTCDLTFKSNHTKFNCTVTIAMVIAIVIVIVAVAYAQWVITRLGPTILFYHQHYSFSLFPNYSRYFKGIILIIPIISTNIPHHSRYYSNYSREQSNYSQE